MPRIKSAKKQMRQNRKHRAVNRDQRSTLRSALKSFSTATGDAVQSAYSAVEKLLDRAARKGLIHKNSAARQKSRMRKGLNAAKK